ncbi:NADH-quinone oxidoreductase subunit J family protein [Persicirhabdus sediminis]|uniref:NADH-quinone oxidoreductase subunit J n=1 Tax=Persicirhabdus sediminis TaxID=454144 RepID=A0A8J7MCK7_9BACT|nr:NADH-quinone oxidoreductase subunit J [Persicirhabdus sediminis]MBK1789995.1 NADH-quinone oxidoreductase subunit J [Persicirhabdus sediminis]
MPSILFYIFSAIMCLGALMVIFNRNPVASALSMLLSFISLAAIFIGLNSYLIGILQILVYSGAVMVLFIFIIMLLDLQKEDKDAFKPAAIAAGIIIPIVLLIQLASVLHVSHQDEQYSQAPELELAEAAKNFPEGSVIATDLSAGKLPDVHLIGHYLFTDYNFPIQVIAVLLLSATVGCVVLSKKISS